VDQINFQVISLDSHPEKYARFLARNSREDISFSRFTAVDGKTLNREYLIANGVISSDLDYQIGALGCAMSHLSLWNLALQTNAIIHVAEDDAVFRHDLGHQMRQALDSISINDFDLIFWGFNRDLNAAFEIPGIGHCMVIMDEADIKDEDDLMAYQASSSPASLMKLTRAFGILSYSISPAGAQKLMKACLPFRPMTQDVSWGDGIGGTLDLMFANVGIDVLMGVILQEQINSYLMFPPLAISLNRQGPPSTTQTNG
jgi:GR25 family glycosyltransferase involved in LPS biosynthesis